MAGDKGRGGGCFGQLAGLNSPRSPYVVLPVPVQNLQDIYKIGGEGEGGGGGEEEKLGLRRRKDVLTTCKAFR